MTQLLERAIAEVQNLSPEEQDALAAIILQEIEDERRWEDRFARAQDQLAALAEKARQDLRGRT